MSNQPAYERPSIVRHQMGGLNKFGQDQRSRVLDDRRDRDPGISPARVQSRQENRNQSHSNDERQEYPQAGLQLVHLIPRNRD